MTSLFTLPNDLKAVIFSDLTTPDLINLAAMCKFFHGYARPLTTERCIDFANGDVNISWNGYRPDGIPHLYFHMIRLITRCVNLESLDISVALLLRYKFFWEELINDETTGNSEWMGKLKCIRRTLETGDKSDWEPEAFSLRREHTSYWDPCDIGEYNDYHDHHDLEEDYWPLEIPPTAHHLTTLRLGFSPAPAAMFGFLLTQTPNLRIFEVELCQQTGNYEFRLQQLKSGLELVKNTLTHLKVRFDVYPEYEGDLDLDTRELVNVVAGSLGSFRDYHALTYLETSLHLLFGSDDSHVGQFYPLSSRLPPSLEELVITDDLYGFNDFQQYFEDGNAMKIFESYLEESTDVTPNLKKFTYDLREKGNTP